MSIENIEQMYIVSPLQETIILGIISSTDTKGNDYSYSQFHCQLHSLLNSSVNLDTFDIATFEKAWQELVNNNSILRTYFVWQRTSKFLQVVNKQQEFSLIKHDWRHLSLEQQRSQLKALLETDKLQDFDPSKAPLFRVTLCRTAENEYELICTYSHLVLDENSFNLLFKQVFECYEEFSQGRDWHSEKSRPFQNYITWLKQQNMSKAEEFWRRMLEDLTLPTSLLTKQTFTKSDKTDYAQKQLQLSQTVTAALESLANQYQLSPNTFLLGVWAILLSRYSGEEDVVFGVTVAGRPQALQENESILGLFTNTLPLRVRVPPNAMLLPWLNQLHNQQNSLRQYDYNSPLQILQWCDIPNDIPLFDSSIVLDYNSQEIYNYNKISNSININNAQHWKHLDCPITIKGEWDKKLTLQINYNRYYFEDETVIRMLEHLQVLLSSIIAQPEQPLSTLPILTEVSLRQLLVEWNNTNTEYSKSKCIHQLFETQVEQQPNAIALIFENKQLTYKQLNQKANQLAHYLQALGVGSEVLVGICMERSFEMVVALLAILKAGGAYVPLDPTYPIERLSLILEDAQPFVLLTQEHLLEQLPSYWAQVVCLDSQAEEIAQESQENPSSKVKPKNLAYVIYTSGSTGTPKGVLVEHQGACNLAETQVRIFNVQPNSRVLQFASLSFDASVWEIVMGLCSGASLCLGTQESLHPGSDLIQLLREQSVTHVTFPPSVLAALPVEDLPELQVIIVAGEACNPKLITQWSACRRFFNAYGPTESTVCATIAECTADTDTQVSIGRPIANTQVYILDRYLQPVPIGVPGELYIGGVCLARGYLRRPELTKEKFIPNPFSEEAGARLYKTGDKARYTSDGNIEYFGRSDYQAKIRGFRIEMGEIEATLTKHTSVQEVIVTSWEKQVDDKQIVAYIVPNGENPQKIELREFLKQKLPEYMIPSAFVILEAMPLTLNGKINRRALPAPDFESSNSVSFIPPSTPRQQAIANIFTEVLQLQQVGIHDNFFELGGHSLNATQVASRLQETFGVELSLRSLFTFPTLGELDKYIGTLEQTKSGLEIPPIEPVSCDIVNLPLSWAQTRLWFIEQLQGGTAAYNIPVAVQITGVLDINALEQSLREIVWRHQVLRTSYHNIDGNAAQVISQEASVILPVVDLQQLPKLEQSEIVQHLAILEAQQPFDLSKSPLLRVTLLQLGQHSHVLLLTMHHIVSDGWSMGILIQELFALYPAFALMQPSPLPELPIQYADFAVWQQKWLQGQALESHLNYWKQQLAFAPPLLELPTDRPRPPIQTFHGSSWEFRLSLELTEKLNQLSKNFGTTLFMTLLAAFVTLLCRYTHQDDILIGTPIANRNRKEIEPLIGFFVNTLVMRSRIQGNPSFAQLLEQVQQVTLEAYEHQDVPFEQLVEVLQLERNLSHSPLFQVMFALQNAPIGKLELPGLNFAVLEIETTTSKFDLTLSMEETSEGLIGSWEYNRHLFDEETIARIAGHFQTMLTAIVTNPQQPIRELPILFDTEQHQLLSVWNEAQTQYPSEKCIHQLFEEQVQQTPDAIAIIFEDQQLTYSELDDRANQLAHHLQSLGVEKEVKVGLCVERSLEMVLGILGILKAGGVYVPLDPAYPQERLAFMLQDARTEVLLTQQNLVKTLPVEAINQTKVVCLDTDWENICLRQGEVIPLNATRDENLAYVIYTSGSTGQPKGTLVSHKNVVRLFQATQSWHHFNKQDVFPLFHSYAFDFSVWEIWGALLYGGRLVIVPHWLSRSPEDFYKFLYTQQVTVLNQTPSAFRQLIRAEESLGTAKELNLRLVIFGGEALEIEYLRPWFERHGDQFPQLFNMYGITETTVHVTYCRVRMTDLEAGSRNIIGRPIPDLQVYILDQYQQQVPIGVKGEMYVGGEGVTRGYLNQPSLTALKFVPHPFSDKRLYKSGDLARYLANGNLEYLGRIDHQVKIRGFRVELGEIENTLAKHPSVQESVVVVRSTELGDNQLIGYVIPDKQQAVTLSDLRNFLLKKIPEYMIPSTFVFLEALPLTANGKVNVQALKAPDTIRPELEEAFVAPCTEEEKILAAIWTKILGLEKVGIDDNFFALGGDSIRSIQVQSQAKKQGLYFSIQQLFQYQTIKQLAQNLITLPTDATSSNTTQSKEAKAFELISPEDRLKLPDDVEDAYPITKLQMGMLFHREYSPEDAVYHDIFSYHLKASFNLQAFRDAIEQIMLHHPVLRTSFNLTNYSEPLQLVHQKVDIPLYVEDISHLSDLEQEEALANWLEAEKKQRFDWLQAPLLHFQIHRRSEETFQFALCCHHAILDGWSTAVMDTEIFNYYLKFLGEKVDTIKASPITSFKDFVALELETLASEKCQRYWTDKLSDSTLTMLPRWPITTETGTSQTDKYENGTYKVAISPEVSDGLNQLARSLGVSIKNVLLAAHAYVLSKLSGQLDIVTGLVSNGRPEEADGERVLGLFLNTLPYRIKLLGGTWKDLVRMAFEVEQELIPERRYPLAELQRVLGRQSLFETVFNYTNFHVLNDVHNIKSIEVLDSKGFSITNFTFLAQFYQLPPSSQINLLFEYNSRELCSQQIEAIGDYYKRTLTTMASEPEGRYESHIMLSMPEQTKQLVEWNNTEAKYPQDQCIHQLFEATVELTPDTIAVVFEDQHLTYRELNAKANQLAHYLRSLGVKPDVQVGICVSRSLDMAIGILGILKAGGACVPLDPAYPQQRLALMLEDTRVPVLLVQEHMYALLPTHNSHIICLDLDEQWNNITLEPDTNPVSGVQIDNLLYVIYTSGSTGQPKGISLSHRALTNLIHWHLTTMTNGLGILQFASLNFDASFHEMFAAWCSGGRLFIIPESLRLDLGGLANFLATNPVEKVILPVAILQQLAQVYGKQEDLFQQLQEVITTGEQLQVTQPIIDLFGRLKNCSLHNHYGPSETHVVTNYTFNKQPDTWAIYPPIGKPIANTQIYILDHHFQPVPVGVPGLLYIGGANLARGYFKRPELTAHKFIPNPYGDGRLYYTGDLACYLPDGNIEFLGRIDEQVKIRGYRIELQEVEAVLGKHPQVSQAVVTVYGTGASEKRLVAYVILQGQTDTTTLQLHDFLQQKLPEYMVPSAFVVLENLPLTSNGKVNRRALPTPEENRFILNQPFVPPSTPAEEVLAAMWTEILGINKIGIYDNFFQIGGHSLLAIQLVSRIRENFGLEITVRHLFQSPTIASIIDVMSDIIGGKEVINEIARTFKEVAELSSEEVLSLLAQKN